MYCPQVYLSLSSYCTQDLRQLNFISCLGQVLLSQLFKKYCKYNTVHHLHDCVACVAANIPYIQMLSGQYTLYYIHHTRLYTRNEYSSKQREMEDGARKFQSFQTHPMDLICQLEIVACPLMKKEVTYNIIVQFQANKNLHPTHSSNGF